MGDEKLIGSHTGSGSLNSDRLHSTPTPRPIHPNRLHRPEGFRACRPAHLRRVPALASAWRAAGPCAAASAHEPASHPRGQSGAGVSGRHSGGRAEAHAGRATEVLFLSNSALVEDKGELVMGRTVGAVLPGVNFYRDVPTLDQDGFPRCGSSSRFHSLNCPRHRPQLSPKVKHPSNNTPQIDHKNMGVIGWRVLSWRGGVVVRRGSSLARSKSRGFSEMVSLGKTAWRLNKARRSSKEKTCIP